MASTSQSARHYVQSARTHLVGRLQHLDVVLEHLDHKQVLTAEEVSAIKKGRDNLEISKNLLECVINKGERSCTEFLRVLDTIRKTSSQQTHASGSSDGFDVNSWVSCYSFEDTGFSQGPAQCYNYQAKLKSKAQQMSDSFWTRSTKVFPTKDVSLSYIPLVLRAASSERTKSESTEGGERRPKEKETYERKENPNISPDELLNSQRKKILLVGGPGIGKTVVVHQILKLWAESDNSKLDYFFYFDMRGRADDTAKHNVEDLLFDAFIEPDGGKDEVLEDIKSHSDRVTIILDGVTGCQGPVTSALMQGNLLPNARIIATCRPEVEALLTDWDPFRVEVQGFTEQSVTDYLSKLLSLDSLHKVVNNLELLTLCSVPMYALMVAACFSFEGYFPQPCTVTRIYLFTFELCILQHRDQASNIDHDKILKLAEAAFYAMREKQVKLTSLHQADSYVHAPFSEIIQMQLCPAVKKPACAFLHYTAQEFFAALWLVENPASGRVVLQQLSHMKALLPFVCGLLKVKNRERFKDVFPSQQLEETSEQFITELVTSFVDRSDAEDFEMDLPLLCQCLYEYQSPAACLHLLDKLNYCLDLSETTLEPQHCCALSYTVKQSDRKIQLNLKGATVSEQGVSILLRCLGNVQRSSSLSQKLWSTSLLAEGRVNYMSLLYFDENQIQLPLYGDRRLFERAVEVIQGSIKKVKVGLYWEETSPSGQSLSEVLPQCVQNINSISVIPDVLSAPSEETRFFGNLFCAAAGIEKETGEKLSEQLASVCSYKTFPLRRKCLDFLLDLYSTDSTACQSVLPSLRSVLQSASPVWSIRLSERRSSILLEVLKLQPEKTEVQLSSFSREESEVRSFLQCLPHISQLSVRPVGSELQEATSFFGNLFCAAAEREMLEQLVSACMYEKFPLRQISGSDEEEEDDEYRSDFLLDLFSHVKDSETNSGFSVLPSLRSVLQAAPPVWSIKLSEGRSSVLLEVLKLQPEKKVQLRDFTREQSEVRSFLQFLPHISELSVYPDLSAFQEGTRFFGNLFCAAAETENQTGEQILERAASVCTYRTFPLRPTFRRDDDDYRSDFLLDLVPHVKDAEMNSGLSVLPSFWSVLQSTPPVWSIDLAAGRSSVLLEVLRLQPEQKEVQLTGFSREGSAVRSFLQCLPHISQLSVHPDVLDLEEETRFFGNLFCAAAESENQTGEKILERVAAACSYRTFPLRQIFCSDEEENDDEYRSDFLLDLFSHVRDKSGSGVLPSLRSILQSAPSVWSTKLSEGRSSVLLEVFKLQPEKKKVQLRGFSREEGEVRSFLQCLPHISELSCAPDFFQKLCSSIVIRSRGDVRQLASLLQLLRFNLTLTGELSRKTCSNVGRVLKLCGSEVHVTLTPRGISAAQTSAIFKHTKQLHSLRLSNHMMLLLFRWVKSGRVARSLAVQELSLARHPAQLSEGEWLKFASGLASFLRYWPATRLDMSQSCVPAHCLISLLLHDGPLTIRLKKETQDQLHSIVNELKDEGLTSGFLSKVGRDLTQD